MSFLVRDREISRMIDLPGRSLSEGILCIWRQLQGYGCKDRVALSNIDLGNTRYKLVLSAVQILLWLMGAQASIFYE